jgi:hypothetical protein
MARLECVIGRARSETSGAAKGSLENFVALFMFGFVARPFAVDG